MITTEKNIDDILYILNNLRTEDKIEAEKISGENFIDKISDTILNSDDKFFLAKDENNIPYAMAGIEKTEEKGAVVIWLLSTPQIIKHRHFALRNIKKELKKIERDNWFIYNFIFEKNYLAKIWLKKLGFDFVKSNQIPENFEMFYKKRQIRGLG